MIIELSKDKEIQDAINFMLPESKSHKSSKKTKSVTTVDGFPKSSKGEIDWSQKVCD